MSLKLKRVGRVSVQMGTNLCIFNIIKNLNNIIGRFAMGYCDSVTMCKRAWWAGIRPWRQAFQHYGVEDMRLNFVDVYPSDCGIHDGAPQQTNVDGWMDGALWSQTEDTIINLLNINPNSGGLLNSLSVEGGGRCAPPPSILPCLTKN